MDELKNTIEDLNEQLPPAFKSLIESKEFEEDILSVGRSHGLHIDQLDTLMLEVKLFAIGANTPEMFKENLESSFNLKGEELNTLINELNSKLFTPLREVLKEMNNKKENESEDTNNPSVSQTQQFPLVGAQTPAPKTGIKDMLTSQKLNQVVYSPHKTTDYSLERGSDTNAKEEIAKNATTPTTKYDMDPYHEIIE